MLILSRKKGETIVINDNIRVTVRDVRGNGQVRISIEAPDEVEVHREEVWIKNKQKEGEK